MEVATQNNLCYKMKKNKNKKIKTLPPYAKPIDHKHQKVIDAIVNKMEEFEVYQVDVQFHISFGECIILLTKHEGESGGLGQAVSFESMLFLYELFGSKKINLNDVKFNGGCITCEHGSKHTGTLIIQDIDFEKVFSK